MRWPAVAGMSARSRRIVQGGCSAPNRSTQLADAAGHTFRLVREDRILSDLFWLSDGQWKAIEPLLPLGWTIVALSARASIHLIR